MKFDKDISIKKKDKKCFNKHVFWLYLKVQQTNYV